MSEYYQKRLSFQAGPELFGLKIHQDEEQRHRDWLERELLRPVPVIYIHARPFLGPGRLERDAGNAQAWIYPEQGVAQLWECYLFEHWRNEERQTALWRAFENFLIGEARIREIYTPGWDPAFARGEYERFLDGLGYRAAERNFRRKEIKCIG